jgi:BirA family biotin operon repressor/biotin-[acetyl-CoA-carboxylase] ligase
LVAVETALETGSTNSDLLTRARVTRPEACVLRAALSQTAGRGRHGRRWFAAPGSALLFSVAVPLRDASVSDGAITLACGVAAAEALRALEVPAQLKWPNDLWLAERKLGGVLCELALDSHGHRTLVVGVGINLWLDPAARASIGQPAAAAEECVPLARLLAQREAWIGRVAGAVLGAVREFEAHGFLPFQPRFMSRFALLGRDVEVIDHGVCGASGRALGVDGEGRLLVQTSTGIVAIASGDVSLRAVSAPSSNPSVPS